MKIMVGTLRVFIILCSFFFFIFFFQDGNHQAFFLPSFFSIIRDSVNRVTKHHPSRHSSPLHEEKKLLNLSNPSNYFSFRNFVKHRRVFILLRVTHWYVKQLWHVLFARKKKLVHRHFSSKECFLSFIIIIVVVIRGINMQKIHV